MFQNNFNRCILLYDGVHIINMRYADDTEKVAAQNETDLQSLPRIVTESNKNLNLKTNINKIKFMISSKNMDTRINRNG